MDEAVGFHVPTLHLNTDFIATLFVGFLDGHPHVPPNVAYHVTTLHGPSSRVDRIKRIYKG